MDTLLHLLPAERPFPVLGLMGQGAQHCREEQGWPPVQRTKLFVWVPKPAAEMSQDTNPACH